MSEPEVIAERRGCCGFILLNRPKALNALNLGMVRAVAAALDAWEDDASIARIAIAGAGGRAFCAGGDIRLLYDEGRAGDHAAQLAFWREEYRLNLRIAQYAKPYVALLDGIVMGGGVGLSLHGSHRIASERLVFAMPETAIGFFPDVGAMQPLARLPGGMGAWLALTGARIDAGEALALGLATHGAPAARFADLEAALAGSEPLDAILSRFAASPPQAAPGASRATIARCFASGEPAEILAALERAAAGGDSAAEALRAAMLAGKSPTTQAIAARQLALYRDLSLADALRTDFRIVSRICRGHDFYEGVRAVIVDTDNQPRWRPDALEKVAPADIDLYFAPLAGGELTFGRE